MTSAPSLRRGVSIVFEGLDKAGKSTQIMKLQEVLSPDSVTFAHMPSGFVPFSRRIYETMEVQGEKPASGLAQQLAHLACHAESINHLIEAVQSKALVLDRWWWSTLAYGWFGGSVEQSGLSEQCFRELIGTIWKPINPSVVFVFLEPHQLDRNNNQGVAAGYLALLDQYADEAVSVPHDTPTGTHDLIFNTLMARQLIVDG
jgi:thymidylate kinase